MPPLYRLLSFRYIRNRWDRAALIVHRTKLSYLVLNRFPYNPGHLLAVPYREVVELEELSGAERADLMEEVIFGRRLLSAAMKPPPN